MNFNFKLILNILTSVNGGLITGAALLQTLIGQDLTLKIVAGLGVAQIIISAVNSNLSTQSNVVQSVLADPNAQEAIIKNVMAMPGIEPLKVNAKANATVAALALDAGQSKISVLPEAQAQVAATAKAG